MKLNFMLQRYLLRGTYMKGEDRVVQPRMTCRQVQVLSGHSFRRVGKLSLAILVSLLLMLVHPLGSSTIGSCMKPFH